MQDLTSLLARIDQLKEKLDAARPLLSPSILNALEIEYTYDSNRIEGNTLTLRETEIIINRGLTVGGKSMREHLEATNHYEAVLFINDLVKGNAWVSQKLILQLHSIVMRGIDRENAGRYRVVPVAIAGSRHTPPPPYQILDLMESLDEWIKTESGNLHPVVYGALLHERIATIHPFVDGNGRTARLLMNLVFLQNGYTIANIPGDSESRIAYYNTLEKCNLENDPSDFLILMAEYLLRSLENVIRLLGVDHETV